MSANEELEEHVHHAHEPFDKTVAASMAIIAALLAVVSVIGQHYETEELLLQAKASDQWSYYQAKDIRRFTAEATRDVVGDLKPNAPDQAKYDRQAAKYKSDAKGIQDQAEDYEKESAASGKKSSWFHFGEIFLEIAIVFSSLAILTKARTLYVAGILLALGGIGVAIAAWLT